MRMPFKWLKYRITTTRTRKIENNRMKVCTHTSNNKHMQTPWWMTMEWTNHRSTFILFSFFFDQFSWNYYHSLAIYIFHIHIFMLPRSIWHLPYSCTDQTHSNEYCTTIQISLCIMLFDINVWSESFRMFQKVFVAL